MKQFFTKFTALCMLFAATTLQAQQLPDPHFEDWSDSFNGDAQPKYWHGSNVEQVGFKFTFLYQKDGRSGKCAYVADKEVGAMGITEVGPGYFGLGYAWQKLEGLNTSSATAGTYGGISFKYRPDSMVVWIKRTGDNTGSEDFNIMFYSWTGTAVGTEYKNKAGKCTSVEKEDEESDIRVALDGNECTTKTPGTQIAEGWLRARQKYSSWTRISIPIYYMSDATPSKCNVIFSAGNYPNFRANSGLYAGNGLYVDDVELIYSNKIQQIFLDNVQWKGFDPNSSDEQVCSLGEDATSVPDIVAKRGVGTLTNSKGKTASFSGRKLSGDEITINKGAIGKVTTITVKDINGNSRVYKIKFVKEASKNTKLAGISVNGEAISTFSPNTFDYTFELPYGTKQVPMVSVEKQEDGQTVQITQPSSVTGKATIKVTAANTAFSATYTVTFKVAELKDNTLKDILINGESLPGFIPSQTFYKVALPLTTTSMPTVTPVSAYEAGAQTIKVTMPTQIDGGKATIDVTTPGNQVPKTYTLNFKLEASSYAKLKELHMVGPIDPLDPSAGTVDYLEGFEPDGATYYVILPLGTTSLPAITYVVGESSQDVQIQPGGLDGTTTVTVTAASGAKMVYRIVISTLKSSVSTLNNLIINGAGTLDPEFDPYTYKYTYTLPDRSSGMPTISWVPGDEYQTVDTVMAGLNETSRINVTAGDGSVTTYQILVAVPKSDVSYLNAIKLGGNLIDQWNKETLEYTVTLEKGENIPEVTYDKGDEYQTVNMRAVTTAPGDCKITVIAENGTKRTYVIHFRLNLSDDATLKSIKMDGAVWDQFNPSVLDYSLILPPGSKTPKVEYEAREGQKVVPAKQNGVYTYTVTAEDGVTTKVYTITITIQKSEDAYLDMIYLNGVNLDGFDKNKADYVYTLDGAVPTITVKPANDAQQITITSPIGAGVATIVVAPDADSDETNVYTITFKKQSDAALLLSKILKNGVQLDGWDAETNEYTVNYSDQVPVITYEYSGDENNITKLETKDKVTIVVEINGETNMYIVHLDKVVSTNALLQGIYLDGTLISGWNANTFDYVKNLSAGEEEPVITWLKAETAQTVVFGQKQNGEYQIVVLAADGETSKTYTVKMQPAQHTDATLTHIYKENVEITNDFVNGVCDGGTVSDGAILPKITYVKKDGQNVVVSDVSANQQRILVVAESGAQKEYIINYTIANGDDVKLSGILVDGVAIKNFDPDVTVYTVKLDERTQQVPAVTPQSDIVGQTYIIKYGRVNARTEIEVISKNKEQVGHYYIDFEVRPLTNISLATLHVGDPYDEDLDVKQLEHTYIYNASAGLPVVTYKKAEEEQRIEYTRQRGGDTEIKVIAQSGQSQTYKIHFTTSKPAAANVLKSLKVNGIDQDVTKDVIDITLPYGTTSLPVVYEPNFDGQSVIVYNGGVSQPTQIIVCANHPDVADKKYTINPTVEPFAKKGNLESLTFKGNPVPNFQPNVYNYVVNVTAEPTAADFVGVAYNGEAVTKTNLDKVKKQIQLKVTNGNTYTISWFYVNDGKYLKNGVYYDYLDFSQDWVATPTVALWLATMTNSGSATSTKKSTGFKPYGWSVPADFVAGLEYSIEMFGTHIVDLYWWTGKEVIAAGTNGALLSTINGASINGSMPGMMTLGGTMAVKPQKKGGSTSSISYDASKFIAFRNTPDSLSMSYKSLSAQLVTGWSYELKTVAGGTTRTNTFLGDYSNSGWRYASLPITAYSGAMSKYALSINSAHTTNAKDMSGSDNIYTSDLQVENIHFVYNSEVTSAKINGKDATVNNSTHTISVTLDKEDVAYPQLTVVGQVEDQEQVITWGEEQYVGGKMVRTGTLHNYGEDHSYTDYTLTTTRDAVTDASLKSVTLGNKAVTFTNNKYEIEKTAPIMALSDIVIVPNSVHQAVAVAHRNDSVIISVTAENGDKKNYLIYFKETGGSDATISIATGDVTPTPAFNKDVTDYTVSVMPDFTFAKELFQSVTMDHNADTTRFYVTAADKVTTKTYTFAVKTKETSANMINLTLDGTTATPVAGTPIKVNKMPKVVLFARQDAKDEVTQTICTDSIVWSFVGIGKTNKYAIVNQNEADHNAYLAGLLVGGEEFEDFVQTKPNQAIPTDTMVDLQFIAGSQLQKLDISLKTENAPKTMVRRAKATVPTFTFVVKVTAKDGNSFVYNFRLEAPKSDDATLKGIVIGNDTIKEFYADKTEYTYVLSTTTPKVNQPDIPAIKYLTSDPQATVEVEPAVLNDANTITVTSAEGSVKLYYLTLTPEKSTYAELNGILIDGTPISGFAADRYYYSVQVEPATNHTIEVSSLDKFITTDIKRNGNTTIIDVTAEDGVHTQRYFVDMYEMAKSNNATLSNLLIYNADSARMIPVANFEPMNNHYEYELKGTVTKMPDVQAVPMVNGQTITPRKEGWNVKIDVLAPDSSASNTYTIEFKRPLDDNAELEFIQLDGVNLKDFDPKTRVYHYDLAVGDSVVPEIYASYANQLVGQKDPDWSNVDNKKLHAAIISYAQNGDSIIYEIFCNKTYSAADTLLDIRYDNKQVKGFSPKVFYYTDTIQAGLSFPDSLECEKADDFQDVIVTRQDSDTYRQVYQIEVKAHHGVTGLHNTYTVTLIRERLGIDTIQGIKINGVPLKEFEAHKFDYSYILPAGSTELPKVECVTEEEKFKQDIKIETAVDSIATKSLNQKVVITVTAENGKYNIYTIHFPVAISADTTLNMIFYGNSNPIPNFFSTTDEYTVELPLGTTNVPQITYLKKETLQNVDQSFDSIDNWTVYVDVTAEDKIHTMRYTIHFVLAKSANVQLKDILLGDSLAVINFKPEQFDYEIAVPYCAERDTTQQMEIVGVPSEAGQTVMVEDAVRYGEKFATKITVTAPNEENIEQYTIVYYYLKNPDASLKQLWLKGDTIEGFLSDTLEYFIEFPVGTDSTQYYTPQNVTYQCSDSLAKVNVKMDQTYTLYIVVTAQDSTSTRTYVIHQTTMMSDDNYLADLLIDETSYRDFDPDKLDYVYYVPVGSTAAPLVEAIPRDPRAMVSIMPNGIDSVTIITCVAENGKKRTYTILFTNSDIDDNATPQPRDVLVKRLFGTNKILIASLRKKVSFGLFDQAGRMVHYIETVEPANPNDVIIAVDGNGQEVLTDVASEASGTVVELNTNQIYFYTFFEAGKKKIASGKLIIMN